MTAERARRRLRVMVVDDHPLVRNAVRQALDTTDLEVIAEAASAEEALRIAPDVQPDVLLVDIELPGMDGVALVRELAPRLPEARIVMLTASREDRHLLDAMRFGAVGYLTKDLSVQGLARAVRAAWEGELAMSRKGAAHLVRRLVETSRRAADPTVAEPVLATLTPREGEVLRLLAEGLTDHEIAQALTLSPRTVEMHVSNVLHKLGVRNRAEAARRYRAGGGGPSSSPRA